MTRMVLVSMAILISACTGDASEPAPFSKYDPTAAEIQIDRTTLNDTEKTLDGIVVPVVDFRQADIRDIVFFFDRCVKEYGGPDQQDDSRRIRFTHHFPDGAVPQPVIAFAIKDVPLLYALRLTCTLGNFEYQVDRTTVTVGKKK